MATKRGLPDCNVLLMSLVAYIRVTIILVQGRDLDKLGAGNLEAMVSSNASSQCWRDGFFEKKLGYVTDIENLSLTGLFLSPSRGECHVLCRQSCFCTVQIMVNLGNNKIGCMFLNGTLEIQEDNRSILEFYTFSRNPSPPPTPHVPAAQPSLAPSERAPNNTYSPSDLPIKNAKGKRRWILILVLGAVFSAFTMCFVALLCYLNAKSSLGLIGLTEEMTRPSSIVPNKLKKHKKLGHGMQLFTFKSICIATNQFSSSNKLGEGGFGPVYKGNLVCGQEVAVKRLSRSSSQGMFEFKNEIKLIAKLQHTNLVRLLGCCVKGSEKILVYEFLPNKSLDSFLFDPAKKKHLGWKKRLEIIGGTAQGLLYLHKYSRLKVIHRDLKTSNILLDSNLNPKISDFGLARIFEQNTSSANTNRIVGTYGYMSPEYAMEGHYSEKSDVFSFGVIVLEIISGRKATSFSGIEHPLNLIRYSWDLWRKGKSLELIDEAIGEICSGEELVRHIQVGLLCVEENASERPTMSDVVSMLTNGSMHLPVPRQPAFYCGKSRKAKTMQEINESKKCSPNLVTLSPVEGR